MKIHCETLAQFIHDAIIRIRCVTGWGSRQLVLNGGAAPSPPILLRKTARELRGTYFNTKYVHCAIDAVLHLTTTGAMAAM